MAITAIGQIQRALASCKRTRGCLVGADPRWIPEDDDLSCRIFKRGPLQPETNLTERRIHRELQHFHRCFENSCSHKRCDRERGRDRLLVVVNRLFHATWGARSAHERLARTRAIEITDVRREDAGGRQKQLQRKPAASDPPVEVCAGAPAEGFLSRRAMFWTPDCFAISRI